MNPAALRSDPHASAWRRWSLLVTALMMSLLVHMALTQWPIRAPGEPEPLPPLEATITELPPPPVAVAAAPKPATKPRVRRAVPVATPEAPVADVAAATPPEPAAEPAAAEPEAPTEAAAPPLDVPALATAEPLAPTKPLPPRVDLAYQAFLGTNGFLIGEAVYRLDHRGNEYKISTVAQARGLASLFVHGEGRATSQGTITSTGLQPSTFTLARTGSGKDRQETVSFDWETGIVVLNNDNAAPLEMPTFDPLVVLWQFYFAPPAQDAIKFNIATTRKVYHYGFRRVRDETVTLPFGAVEAQVWERESGDGQLDAQVWMAPSLHFVAVKVRLSNPRATIELRLDSIRVDATVAQQ
ncbi:MAG: DUF3108 domain-containing protein [Casimicrobiaceae bacterium]